MKKLKKDSQGRYIDGVYDYATFYKEALIMEDGVAVVFNTSDAAFKCAYNTTMKVINQCLDERNVPNLDSSWRYAFLREQLCDFFAMKQL